MKIKKDELVFVLRYSKKIEKDCIKKHIEELKNNKYVWWGKCGARTSQKNIDFILAEERPKLILYSSTDKCYLCEISEITYEKPETGYPKYYNEVFDEDFYPTTYFKINSINELKRMYLTHFVVNSTEREILDLMVNSMTTQCISKAKDDFDIE